jgi:photosystem II stability/assembly factor-like uncharacterized protein
MRATSIVAGIGTTLLLLAGLPPAALAAPAGPVAAEVMPLAAKRSIILSFTETNARAIAVGERGHVLLSESRSDWRQVADVPTRATLTAVTAVGDRAWAVGHDGTILHSSDGGLSWVLQREEVWAPPTDDEDAFSRDPSSGAPLLGVLFTDASNGYAIGAYATLLRTRDGGASWARTAVTVDNVGQADAGAVDEIIDDDDNWTFDQDDLTLDFEEDPHLNGIVQLGDGSLFVVAERGSAFRSRDGGDSWERIQLPYDGSMFGVIALGGQHLLAYGLRGNVLESRDGGDSWVEVDTGVEFSLMGGAALEGGGVVVVGTNGAVLHRPDSDSPFRLSIFENENDETPVLADVLPLGLRSMLVCGERGIGRFQLDAPEASR